MFIFLKFKSVLRELIHEKSMKNEFEIY